jgi:hypothetical protein
MCKWVWVWRCFNLKKIYRYMYYSYTSSNSSNQYLILLWYGFAFDTVQVHIQYVVYPLFYSSLTDEFGLWYVFGAFQIQLHVLPQIKTTTIPMLVPEKKQYKLVINAIGLWPHMILRSQKIHENPNRRRKSNWILSVKIESHNHCTKAPLVIQCVFYVNIIIRYVFHFT